jgi:hypothetical protein
LKLGNLNGSYGYSTDVYGFATGQYATASKSWLTIEQTNGIRIGTNTTKLAQWYTSGTLTLYDSNGTRKLIINTSGIFIGDYNSGYYTYGTSTGLEIYANSLKVASYGTEVLIGRVAASQNNVLISSGAIYFRNNTTNIISITNTGVGSINLLTGSDITLTGDNASPAKIIFNGSSYDTEFYSLSSGSNVYLKPLTDNQTILYLGSYGNIFKNAWLYARTSTIVGSYDGNDYASIAVYGLAQSTVVLSSTDDGTERTITFNGYYFTPSAYASAPVGLGYGSTYQFSVGYFYDVYTHDGGVHTSDEKLKKDIVTSTLGLDFICKLNPIAFKWKNRVRTHYGFSAQEVGKVLSEMGISTNDFAGYIHVPALEPMGDFEGSPETWGLRYTEFIAPMAMAIQELKEKITDLEKRL